MNLLRGRRVVEEETSSPLAAVGAWARGLDRAKEGRDRSIAQARRQGASFREIAGAAGVSLSRVQQIVAAPLPFGPARSPVTEVDLFLRAGGKGDVDEAERVFSLRSVAPWVEEWETERAFITSAPERATSNSRYDLSHEVIDLHPRVTWTVGYVAETREVYAFQNTGVDVGGEKDNLERAAALQAGALRGPCVLLGHAYSYRLLSDAIDTALLNICQRPGGLAFVYGRLRLLNRVLGTIAGSSDREQMWKYLEALPSEERR